MAKAQIALTDGTNVRIEGTPDEIAVAVERLRQGSGKARRGARSKVQRVTLTDLLGSLIDGGFFKKPKDLASVKAALEEMGHHYPVTTLSPIMLRQVRSRNLRRLKQDKRWMYTG